MACHAPLFTNTLASSHRANKDETQCSDKLIAPTVQTPKVVARVAREPGASAACPVSAATEVLATEGGLEARGAIFTRPEVVDFILDLAGSIDRII